jgi:hypothetical protein
MDLTNAIVGMKQAATMSKIQTAVAKKVMENEQMQGAAAIKLLNAASAGASKAGDELVAAATGLGGAIDTYA